MNDQLALLLRGGDERRVLRRVACRNASLGREADDFLREPRRTQRAANAKDQQQAQACDGLHGRVHHTMRASTISTSVTVIAPPIRVAIWANGMSCMRSAAVRMATSPVPPCPLWHALMIATSIGYIFRRRPTRNPVPINVITVQMMVSSVGSVKAAISLSHGVSETPIANSSG